MKIAGVSIDFSRKSFNKVKPLILGTFTSKRSKSKVWEYKRLSASAPLNTLITS